MWLFLLLICVGFQVSAKHGGKYSESGSSGPSDETDEPVPLSDSMLDLRGSLRKLFALEAALEDNGRNMICSPMSALMPLGKLLLGAEKESERELMSALGIKSRKQIKSAFTQLIANLNYLPGVTLDLASRIYVNSKKNFNKKYMKRTKKIFHATTTRLKVRDPRKAASQINQWVSSKTRRKITKLINPSDIDEKTSMILVNAIYFAGKWKDRFKDVHAEDFHSPSGKRKIPMMSRQGDYNYWQCDNLNAQIIEIPYEGEASSMIIVLPYSKSGLPVVLRALKLAPELLNQALEKMKVASVILTMPKFKIESEFDLNHLYRKVGVRTIFDVRHSKLNGIVNKETLFVSKSIHKAIIEVNEKGTEAAAASGVVLLLLSQKISIKFKADHPFLFFIKANQEQLFAGTFITPK